MANTGQTREHDHEHNVRTGHETHQHTHGAIDPSIFASRHGIWAIKWSFAGLFATAAFQLAIAYFSGSVALLADTIHNFGDAATAIPLWIAFTLARRAATKRFTYGYGRVEDLAGIVVVLTVLLSAAVAFFEALDRLRHPQPVGLLWVVVVAALVGFLGNEGVAIFRIRVGQEIGSAALIADGYHARTDGLASLSVLVGALGVWLGYPLADPIVGLLITLVILRIVWDSAKSVLERMLDGVDPEVVDEVRHAVRHVPGIVDVSEVRVRWLGHRMHAEVNVAVEPDVPVHAAHDIAVQARHELLHHLEYLSNATIHVDPAHASGEEHHRVGEHQHGDLPAHPH